MIAVLLSVLIPLTIILGWYRFYLICLFGILTGFSLAAGLLSSPQNRDLITLLLGVLTLPGFAVLLTLMATSSVQAFEASSRTLTPFVAYALAAFVGSIIIARLWRNIPLMNQKETPEKENSGI